MIDDDILAVARQLAEQEKESVGKVLSSLARQGLARASRGARAQRNGIPLLSSHKKAVPVTLATVNQLRDEPL